MIKFVKSFKHLVSLELWILIAGVVMTCASALAFAGWWIDYFLLFQNWGGGTRMAIPTCALFFLNGLALVQISYALHRLNRRVCLCALADVLLLPAPSCVLAQGELHALRDDVRAIIERLDRTPAA